MLHIRVGPNKGLSYDYEVNEYKDTKNMFHNIDKLEGSLWAATISQFCKPQLFSNTWHDRH